MKNLLIILFATFGLIGCEASKTDSTGEEQPNAPTGTAAQFLVKVDGVDGESAAVALENVDQVLGTMRRRASRPVVPMQRAWPRLRSVTSKNTWLGSSPMDMTMSTV